MNNKTVNRIIFFSTLPILLGVLFFVYSNQETQSKINAIKCPDCNVLIYSIDILRYDAIDCEHNRQNTPNICAFMKEGLTLNNHAVHHEVTENSMATLLTSQYPLFLDISSQTKDTIHPDTLTLPSYLSEYGYLTSLYGNLGNHLVFNGFDDLTERYGTSFHQYTTKLSKLQPFFSYVYSANNHFPYCDNSNKEKIFLQLGEGVEKFPETCSALYDVFTSYLWENRYEIFNTSYIESNPQLFEKEAFAKAQESVMTLIFTLNEDNYKSIISGDFINLFDRPVFYYSSIFRDDFLEEKLTNNEQFLNKIHELYLARVREEDTAFGFFLNEVIKNQLYDTTIIILTSEHGEEFGEHGKLSHWNNLYQEILHVPFIIRVPNYAYEGSSSKLLTSHVDVFPTLLDILDLQKPDSLKGTSFLSLLVGQNRRGWDNIHLAEKINSNGTVFSFREDNHKVIFTYDEKNNTANFEVYDLEKDPLEQRNIATENVNLTKKLLNNFQKARAKRRLSPLPKFDTNDIRENKKEINRENLIQGGYF